jgi:phage tail P2-like protein
MSGLLPGNASPWQKAIEQAISRISDVPVPISTIKVAQETDPRVLTALGWEWSVNEWQSAWADQRKRDVVDTSPAVHRVLGTAGAMRRAIDALGYQVEMQEWFQYDGDPYCFRVSFSLDEQTLTVPEYLMIQRVALDTKNVRSFFEGFAATRTQPGKIRYGFGLGGTVERSFQPPEAPIYEFYGWIGAGIGQHPIYIDATFQPLP